MTNVLYDIHERYSTSIPPSLYATPAVAMTMAPEELPPDETPPVEPPPEEPAPDETPPDEPPAED